MSKARHNKHKEVFDKLRAEREIPINISYKVKFALIPVLYIVNMILISVILCPEISQAERLLNVPQFLIWDFDCAR